MEPLHRQGRMSLPSSGSSPSRHIRHCLLSSASVSSGIAKSSLVKLQHVEEYGDCVDAPPDSLSLSVRKCGESDVESTGAHCTLTCHQCGGVGTVRRIGRASVSSCLQLVSASLRSSWIATGIRQTQALEQAGLRRVCRRARHVV